MDRLANIYLIMETYSEDDIGQQVATESERGPFCASVGGITRQEWNAAGQEGLQPLCMCKLWDSGAYEGEKLARLEGCEGISDGRYSIYRVYPTDDGGIELYIRRDAGT